VALVPYDEYCLVAVGYWVVVELGLCDQVERLAVPLDEDEDAADPDKDNMDLPDKLVQEVDPNLRLVHPHLNWSHIVHNTHSKQRNLRLPKRQEL
jgi:hypothetical protein